MLKRVVNKVGRMSPDFVSHWFVKIPFKFRHGSVYSRFEKKIKESRSWTEKELENYVITNFANIFEHAKNFNMYREKYKKAGVFDLVIKNIEDIKKVPILTRSEIRAHITEFQGDFLTQTSGTSGNPLAVYLDGEVWAREWPHYHYIWSKAAYHYEDVKFVIKRQHLNKKFISYSFEHNEFIVNTYKMTKANISEFFKVLIEHDVKYFHGYPSSIADFLKEIDKKVSKERRLLLKDQIKCCFFCSEIPLPHIVKYIRNIWDFDFIASYGHTEACVLGGAPKNQLNYEAFHTYGYIEAENNMLLGTSYHNTDMPLIRYNTDDIIRAKRYQNGIVKSFEVKEGRVFDYIIDKHGLKIAYVGLFLERDHEIWDHIDYFQIFQERQGTATILISHSKDEVLDAPSLMNMEDFDINFDYVYLKEPIRTTSGKVPLRVHKLPV